MWVEELECVKWGLECVNGGYNVCRGVRVCEVRLEYVTRGLECMQWSYSVYSGVRVCAERLECVQWG